ncbi:hypothetical protein A3Q56_05673, partial [Intoshia linei]
MRLNTKQIINLRSLEYGKNLHVILIVIIAVVNQYLKIIAQISPNLPSSQSRIESSSEFELSQKSQYLIRKLKSYNVTNVDVNSTTHRMRHK